MKNYLKYSLLFSTLLLAIPLHAEEEVQTLQKLEVNATRSNLDPQNIPSSVTIITHEEIKQKQIPRVKELLREVLGADVVQQGPLGGLTSIFLRGNGSGATLVLIDGVQVNSNSAGAYNFSALPTDNIERIEVLRGPQSTLWGADAAGGVINIVTRRGKGKPTHSLTVEGGGYSTFKETIGSSGALDDFDYSVTASRTDSEGFSAADADLGNLERDGIQNSVFSTRVGTNFLDDGRIDIIGRYAYNTVDQDAFTDSPQIGVRKIFQVSLPVEKSVTDWWDVKLTPSISSHDSETFRASFQSHIINNTYTIDLQNTFSVGDYFTFVLGGEYQQRTAKYIKIMTFGRVNNYATFMQGIFNYKDRLIITGGVRHDINSQFEDSTTYKIEAAYNIKKTGTRIRGAYATGFRAPTFNDLFFPPFDFQLGLGIQPTSNPDLKPEKTKSWEAGFDQSFLDGILQIGSTYFDSRITDLIQFDATRNIFTDPLAFIPFNLSNATSRGTESYIKLKFDNSAISVTHTWNEALDEDGNQLIRRARHKLSANIHHTWNKLRATIGVNFKTGINESGGRTTDDYKTVRAVLEYQLLKNLIITARGENLFDENYQESVGFGTPRLAGYLGFILSSD